jgi:hypothetical protein
LAPDEVVLGRKPVSAFQSTSPIASGAMGLFMKPKGFLSFVKRENTSPSPFERGKGEGSTLGLKPFPSFPFPTGRG